MRFLKILPTVVMASAMMVFATACDSDDDTPSVNGGSDDTPKTSEGSVSLSSYTLSYDVNGSEKTVYVTATAPWEAVSSDSWLTVSPSSGSGTSSVKVTAASNYSASGSDPREGTVTFSLASGGGEVVLEVSQDGNEYDPNTYWYTEDWEWFDAWTQRGGSSGPAGDCVGSNTAGVYAPNFDSLVLEDGTSLLAKWIDMGYTLIGQCVSGSVPDNNGWPSPNDSEYATTYVQMNYPKIGRTGYQGGIVCPPFVNIPPADAKLEMYLEWCPYRDDDGTVDTVNVLLEFETDGNVVEVDVPTVNWEIDHAMEWIPVTIDLTAAGVKITSSTTLTFKTKQWGVSTRHRWLLDNIKIYTPGE